MYREYPTREECIEALEVMIERYGVRRTEEMLEQARHNLRQEKQDPEEV